jgi:hypothetical protein
MINNSTSSLPKPKPSAANQLPIPVELIARRIYRIRGQKVMLDSDLAELYQVPTKRLNEAVKRNLDRFPSDFMFQLSKAELENWRSQFATSNPAARMGLRRPPYAFTEHGVAMLSSVLNSDRAVQMNILIIRAFVQIRELLATNKDLAARVDKLEAGQKDHASIIGILAEEIDELRLLPEPPKRRIGYKTDQ